ncbi:MAG TPA: sugar phosphate isomerase/epimerase family protein [Bryobacteraceae bacterium]|nr:sugar phosphate isomerase/epimerase family protein [Bryobacteraceae bacterium]
MNPKLPIAAITDEFSPDLKEALDAMAPIGMMGAELRVCWGRNIMDLSDAELDRAIDLVNAKGMQVISIASPILKCVLPEGGDVDTRFQQDVFASTHTFDDQPRLAERAFTIARRTGAKIVRVFSYWRTVEPDRCFRGIVKALHWLGDQAAQHGVIIGLENEHACNVGTAVETAKVLAAVGHPSVKLVWDPANALVAGEIPYPNGYRLLPPERIVHVHVKDCQMEGHRPIWGPVGTRAVDWKGQIAALVADGYRGWLSLETHWPGPGGNDKMAASTICGWNLRGLAAM